MAKRRVERIHIDRWIERNKPNGIAKFSIESGASIALINVVRTGYVPLKQTTRERICEALKLTEDEVFPLIRQGKNKVAG